MFDIVVKAVAMLSHQALDEIGQVAVLGEIGSEFGLHRVLVQ